MFGRNNMSFTSSEYDQVLLGLYSDAMKKRGSEKSLQIWDGGLSMLRPNLIGRPVVLEANSSIYPNSNSKSLLLKGNGAWARQAMMTIQDSTIPLSEISAEVESPKDLEYYVRSEAKGKEVSSYQGILASVALIGAEVRALVIRPDDGIHFGTSGDYAVATIINGHTSVIDVVIHTSIRES